MLANEYHYSRFPTLASTFPHGYHTIGNWGMFACENPMLQAHEPASSYFVSDTIAIPPDYARHVEETGCVHPDHQH